MLSLKDVKLRSMQEDDLEMVLSWRNSEHVRRYSLTDHIIIIEEHRNWFKGTINNAACEWLVAEYKKTPVGVISITEINKQDGTCTWGMYIDKNFSNLGIGILMEICAIDRMINYHHIRKIWGQALASNRIIKTHKRFGFVEEGILKYHIFRNGKYEDVILIGLFTDTWKTNRKQMVEMLNLKED